MIMIKKISFALGLLLMASLGLSSCGSVYYEGPVSDHFDGERFFNPDFPEPEDRSLFTFLKWRFFGGERDEWPTQDWPLNQKDKPPARVDGTALRISYVGHASLLIQTQSMNILTDPIWSKRASPISFMGPKRLVPPGVDFDDLPKIDLVLISHNHYDHLDKDTIIRLWERDKPRIIVPLGNDTIITSFDKRVRSEAYDWHDEIPLQNGLSLTVVPVQHWSARGVFDRNRALWSGYVIEDHNLDDKGQKPGAIYFGGDLGYGDGSQFTKLLDKFPKIRFAALAMGAFLPRWFMEYSHMGPRDALNAYMDLKAEYAIGIHQGVFPLGGDGPTRARDEFEKALPDFPTAKDRFRLLDVGQAWAIN